MADEADRDSDVYSLGVILFQLLTGELPFCGNARMLMHQVIHDEPPSPRKLNANASKDLETICLKCLEKDPERCYQTARELAPIGRTYAEWIDCSPDGETLASGGKERTAKLWQTNPPRLITTLRGHMDVVYHGTFSPDGKTLATASWDGTVRLWHVVTGQELMVLRGTTGLPVWNVAFAPDGSSLVMGSGFRQPGNITGELVIWRAAMDSSARTKKPP